MPEYLAPGVYVEEISRGPKPIEGVSTSTVGFAGATERGPEFVKFIGSWIEFQRRFGGYDYNRTYLPHAVQGFFNKGGKRCKRRTEKGFTDRALTEQLAVKLETEAMLRKRGLIDPAQEKLSQEGQSAIEVHLQAFEESLADNTSKHVRLTMTRVRAIVDGCGFQRIAEIEAEQVQTFLRRLKAARRARQSDVRQPPEHAALRIAACERRSAVASRMHELVRAHPRFGSMGSLAEAVPESVATAGAAARFAWNEFFYGEIRNAHSWRREWRGSSLVQRGFAAAFVSAGFVSCRTRLC